MKLFFIEGDNMYIQEEEMLHLVQKQELLSDFKENNLHNISYDLRIQKMHWLVDTAPHEASSHVLKPGDSVFVSTIENLKLPNNLLGFIIPRNSSIRMGLDIVSPVYQPGHHTKVFVRVTNIADNEITLHEGASIFSIMFYQLNGNVTHPYDGVYKQQFDFANVNSIHSVQTAMYNAAHSAKEQVEGITKNIYATVLTLMSIFIAMFSVITLNAKGLPVPQTGIGVIFYNFVLIGAMSAFVLMVSFLIDRISCKVKCGLMGIFIICFIGALLLVDKL